MQNIFKDYSEYIVLAISLLVVSPILYFTRRKSKSLSYWVGSIITIVDKNLMLAPSLRILYNETPVEHVEIISIRFTNNGKEPILKNDFVNPISITLDEDTTILSMDQSTPNISLLGSFYEKNQAFITFDLLNPKQSFYVHIICNSKPKIQSITSRIAGITKIVQHKHFLIHYRWYFVGLFFLIGIGIGQFSWDFEFSNKNSKLLVFFGFIFFAGAAFYFFEMLTLETERRRSAK